MDGLTFSAAIIQASIWPLFCAGLLYIFRVHVTRALANATGTSRPAAWQFVFQIELQRARAVARALPWRPRPEVARVGQEKSFATAPRAARAAEEGPGKVLPGGPRGVTLIVDAWEAAERQCSEAYRKRLHLPEGLSLEAVVLSLHGKGRIEAPALLLFCHLQSARDAAGHGADVSGVETQDFLDIMDQLERVVLGSIDGLLPVANGSRPGDGLGALQVTNSVFRQPSRIE